MKIEVNCSFNKVNRRYDLTILVYYNEVPYHTYAFSSNLPPPDILVEMVKNVKEKVVGNTLTELERSCWHEFGDVKMVWL